MAIAHCHHMLLPQSIVLQLVHSNFTEKQILGNTVIVQEA